jgi:hypothetical protein
MSKGGKPAKAKRSATNPLLFRLPLANLQGWILEHEHFDEAAITEGYKAIKDLMSGRNATDVVFAASIVLAQYLSQRGKDMDPTANLALALANESFRAIIDVSEEGTTTVGESD